MARNTTDEGRRKGAETARRNLDMIPTGGIRDPIRANAEFERLLAGRCFCPRGKHNPNCKTEPVPPDTPLLSVTV